MNILVLSSRAPSPPKRADQMTVDQLVRFLARRGHAVDLACFAESDAEEQALRRALGSVCRRLIVLPLPRWRSYANTALTLPGDLPMQARYFESRAMHRTLAEAVRDGAYDLCYTHLIRMAEYGRRLPLPKVLGMQISQGLNLRRMVDAASDPFRRTFYRIEERKARRYEVAVSRDFDRVFLCGQRDVEEIRKQDPAANLVVCPHGQDAPPLTEIRAARREPGVIVFCGVMATYTNVDAASWFAREIFPRVERAVPGASFWIVGRDPQRSIEALAQPPRIVVTGEVDNVFAWLSRAAVSVDPLRVGAGMQNKVLQAMAAELPVVATSVANEGIGAAPGTEIVLRDDAESFAAAVIELLRDEDARTRVGRAGRRFLEDHWTWEAHFLKEEKIFREVAESGAREAIARS